MIHLVRIGNVPIHILKELAHSLSKTFKLPVKMHKPIHVPDKGYDSEHHQYSSTEILKTLVKWDEQIRYPSKVLGITSVDLYAEGLHFVFGEADFDKGVAIISLARLDPEFYDHTSNDALYHNRILKEAIHEVGHTYRLLHCPDELCVMHFSSTIRDTDRKGWKFCMKCKEKLDQKETSEVTGRII
ncbi:MAG TPA: archaemetzincin family Zn-dependent metalloprotease [Nitrospiria bacterium]|jgi:archaemetzincin